MFSRYSIPFLYLTSFLYLLKKQCIQISKLRPRKMSELPSPYEVYILFNGYSHNVQGGARANCTCTLVKGAKNIIIDTLTAWDGAKLTMALKKYNLNCSDIDYVICTHGHSDHIGCNYLFQNAVHIVGFCVSQNDFYFTTNFSFDEEYIIDDHVKVIPTPGHTMQDVSVIVKTLNQGVVVIAGDLFENEADLSNDLIWQEAGSDSVENQILNRNKVLEIADWIVPGHGPMFQVRK